MKSGQVEEYRKLSQFRDLKDFNNHIEQWMVDLKKEFTKGELIALKRLVRFSAKIAGICYAKIATIVAATHEKNDMGGISRSTFERMLRKAKKFGLLSVINTTTKQNRQGHNVYVFRKYKSVQKEVEKVENTTVNEEVVQTSNTNDVPNVENIEGAIKTSNLYQTSNLKDHNKRTNSVNKKKLSAEFVSNKVPKQFVDLAKCYWNDALTIEEFWKVVSYQTRTLTNYSKRDKSDLAIEALRQLVRNIKLGRRKINNIFGYFYGIVDKILDQRYINELVEMQSDLY